jgi:ParB family chromosome partitioning protein
LKAKTKSLRPDENQPREDFHDIDKLAQTIKREGMLQPIIVDNENVIIDGERRWRAAKLIGLQEVPILKANVNDKKKRLVWQCLVDVQHHGLPTIVRDKAWLKLWKSLNKPSHEDFARLIGVNTPAVKVALERAEFAIREDIDDEVSGKIVTSTKGLPDDIRKKAVEKMTRDNIRTPEHVTSFSNRLKRAKSREEQEVIIGEPVSGESKTADRMMLGADLIRKYYNASFLDRVPVSKRWLLYNSLDLAMKHIRKEHSGEKIREMKEAQEGEIVE